MERLPNGRLIAIDRSWNMLMTARANLRPLLGSRVSFAQVSLPDMPFAAGPIWCSAPRRFHWVKDHPALFAGIFTTLRSGGSCTRSAAAAESRARARARGAVMHSADSHVLS
jgi:trans-aconitate methyltransferase